MRPLKRKGNYVFKHREHGSSLYNRWCLMKKRCSNPKDSRWSSYGGRGVKVCAEWQEFIPFRDWANKSGYREELTIDRIDVNGDYHPENCRWVTTAIQAGNTRTNHYILYKGEKKTMTEWARISGLKVETLFYRLKNGWEVAEAIETPVKSLRLSVWGTSDSYLRYSPPLLSLLS